MTLAFADEETTVRESEPTPDVIPAVTDVANPCRECGREIDVVYGGRGRRPVRCSTCKPPKSSGGNTRTRVTGNNAQLAAQATEALCSIDGMMALGARIVGFTQTAEVIEEADATFRERVHMALLNSPDTARKILRYGSKAGDSALFIAIALHIATIAPAFMNEAKEKKAEKLAREAEQESE